MCADVLTKNLQGLLFEKHSKHYVCDNESEETEHQQAGEAAGMKEKDMKRGGSLEQDWSKRVRLPPFSNDNVGNCEHKMEIRDDLNKESDKNCENESKAQMFDMGWMKNG
jgi:hypothetical protein